MPRLCEIGWTRACRYMRCVDINVLVYAHRPESPDHEAYRSWLNAARVAAESLGLVDVVSSGFVRIVTHPGIFQEPTPVAEALEFASVLRASPSVVPVSSGERHWPMFTDLCTRVGAKGNQIPDAYLAAVAIEQGATWITADRGFARFPGLRWQHPLDTEARA